MGPVISGDSRTRIEALIAQGISGGAKPVVDGRNARISGYEKGHFIRPTVLDDVDPAGELARTEVFGPVLSMMRIRLRMRSTWSTDLPTGIWRASSRAAVPPRGSSATRRAWATSASTSAWRRWPTSPSPAGRKAFWRPARQGRDAIDFYTEKKIVVERWPANWSRKF